jgi:hypothetical protein
MFLPMIVPRWPYYAAADLDMSPRMPASWVSSRQALTLKQLVQLSHGFETGNGILTGNKSHVLPT